MNRGWSLVAVASLSCATSSSQSRRPVELASTPVRADNSIGQRAEDVLKSLQAKDFARATAHFDATMSSGLPPNKLEATWGQLTAQLGSLQLWTLAEQLQHEGKEVRVYLLQFERGQLKGIIAVDPGSLLVAGLHFAPLRATAPEPRREQRTCSDGAFRSEELSIGPSGRELGATLTAPCGDARASAVLVAGSGPQDRDETIGSRKPFQALAEALSSAGTVVLRFDKRTHAHPGQVDLAHLTVDKEVIDDAVSAVQALHVHPSAQGSRLFIVGHSLGAVVAPEIAERAGGVAGLVLIAPPGRPLPLLVASQLRALGSPDADEVERQARLLLAGALHPNASFFGAPVFYWVDLEERRELARAARLDLPMLVLRGSADAQVADEDLQIWRRQLGESRRKQIETLPGMDHLLGNADNSASLAPGLPARLVRFFAEAL